VLAHLLVTQPMPSGSTIRARVRVATSVAETLAASWPSKA
jgi:hypothetical protein